MNSHMGQPGVETFELPASAFGSAPCEAVGAEEAGVSDILAVD